MRESEPVPYVGVEAVEERNDGKRVAEATLTIRADPDGPETAPNRHVVAVTTTDGTTYRFQRYGFDEPLSFYEREHADGRLFRKRSPAPANVLAVVEAIDGDHPIHADEDRLWSAEINLGLRDTDYYDESRLTAPSPSTQPPEGADVPAVTDGGESAHDQHADAERDTNNDRD